MKEYVSELLQRIDNRWSIDSKDMSLGDWICENTHLRSKPFSFERYPFQKAIADDMHPNMDVIKPSQVGLALDLDTPVPTPQGWTTMGGVTIGDTLYDEAGNPTMVTYVSPVYLNRECFEIEFSDGSKVVTDGEHRWYVECDKAFNNSGLCYQTGRLPKNSDWRRNGVIRTELLSRVYKTGKRNHFAIPPTKTLVGHDEGIDIDPYLLGLWLGDGSRVSGQVTNQWHDYLEIQEELARRDLVTEIKTGGEGGTVSYSVNPRGAVRKHRTWGVDKEWVKTTHCSLSENDLVGNKHIPPQYLRASTETRLDLLRGLMDTDGSITKKGRASFHNTDPQLVDDVAELLHSLGFVSRVRWKKPSPSTLKCGHSINSRLPIAELSFVAYADTPVFHLSRKRARQPLSERGRPSEALRRRIVSVQPVASRPVRCLTVDSPNHLFLCGRAMIPTHNTEIQVRKALAFITRNRHTSLIFTMPSDEMFERMSSTRILPLVKEEKVFNLEGTSNEKPVRSKGLIQIGQSFMFVTGAKEGDATSISADVVFNDEIDLTDQSMLALFNSRLQNSDWKINQRFSTPTFVGFGVDAGYQVSDQHEYMCRCASCGHYNIPTFTERFVDLPGLPSDVPLVEIDEALIDTGRIDLLNAQVVCEKCRAPLDLGNTSAREWVAKYASRTHARGYRVRPFSTDRLRVDYIISQMLRYRQRDYMRGWYNTVLGEAFTDENARLSDAQINLCFTARSMVPEIDAQAPSWIGIDIGQTCHLILSQGDTLSNQHVVMFKSLPVGKLIEEVETLLKTYNVIGGACDRHPYTPTAEELFKVSAGKIMPVEYRGQKDLNFVKDPVTEEVLHAQANRTKLIDEFAKMVRKQYVRFSGYGNQRSLITEHLKDMVRDETPEKPATWIKLKGNDHYFHAGAFLAAGMMIKELQRGLFEDPRGTVVITGAAFGQENATPFQIDRKRELPLGRI